MKKNDQDKRLKQLSDQHEVPFNPEAWERMDALLDSMPPPEDPRPGASFFNYKNSLALIFLLLLMIYFILPTSESSSEIPSTQTADSSLIENTDATKITDTTKQFSKSIPNNNTDDRDSNNQRKISKSNLISSNIKQPTLISQPVAVSPLPLDQIDQLQEDSMHVFMNTIPANPALVESIEEQLLTYHQFRAEEKVYLHFDRKMLKPGETLWFNAYVREANNLKPSTKSDIVHVEFIAPNGGVLKRLSLVTKNGIAQGDIQTTDEMVGGIYKVKAYTNWQRNFETFFERNITLQKTVLPHLRMELDFARETYGPGDEVVAQLELKSLENTPLTQFDFDYQITLAGQNISQEKSHTNEKGKAAFKFKLPEDLDTNDGLVNVLLQYNGQGESIARAIPIVLNKIDIQFFPEGGDWVAGQQQRIAFKALNEYGKPADVEGHILNSKGEIVEAFKSYHQGMGAFNLKGIFGEKYTAIITKPENIQNEIFLPKILNKGNTLQVVQQTNDGLQVAIQSTNDESLTLVLQSQGKVYNSISTSANAGVHMFNMATKDAPVGLAQLTLFDDQERPHAERLVFLNKEKTLDIKISTDKEQYLPREKVQMRIAVKDEDGKPVRGNFSVGVTDDKLLSFADDKQGDILAYLLLESDLKGTIEEPNFYFEPKEKHADKDQNLALDYLLMTHGWRRFTWKNEAKPMAGMIHTNEKAVIGGTVVNHLGEPIKNAIVRIEGRKEMVVSDSTGRFTFNNISLVGDRNYGVSQLSIVASKGTKSKILVNNYGDEYVLWLKNENQDKFVTKTFPSQGNRLIRGRITDSNGEPMIGASITLGNQDNVGTTTDLDGFYSLKVPDGEHILKVNYTGYDKIEEVVSFKDDESLLANVVLNEQPMLQEVIVQNRILEEWNSEQDLKDVLEGRVRGMVVTDFREPLIQQDITATGSTVTSEQIKNLPTRNTTILAVNASADVVELGEEGVPVTLKGSRANFTDYYIDGIRVTGNLLPESEIAEMQIITGGVPARFEGSGIDFSESNQRGDFASNTVIGYGSLDNSLRQPIAEGGTIAQRGNKKNRITMVGDRVILTDEPIVILDGDVLDRLALANIKPDEIQSVEVHEGDALAADYGERGENGVIVINTKKRKGTSSNQALLDYQNQLVGKINQQINDYHNQYELAKRMLANRSLNAAETRDLRIKLYAQLSKITSKRNVTAELGRLTGIYPSTNFVEKNLDFIQEHEYSRNFKNGFYLAREFYVPKYKSKIKGELRNDFRPTIFWNSNIETDELGQANVEFYNSDDLTTFKVTVEGITPNGKIGNNTHTYFTQMPFGMRTKLPTQVLIGDQLNIPVSISNNTDEKMEVILEAIVPQGFEYVGQDSLSYTIKSQSSKTIYLPFNIKGAVGIQDVEVRVKGNDNQDSFSRKIKVLSRGFPVNMMLSGKAVESDFNVDISNVIGKNAKVTFTAHPTLLGELSAGMDRMIRQPTGCFEQTSSKNYPNLLVLDYLQNTNSLSQDLGEKLYDVLEKGYQRLQTFEVNGGGFDWYGKPAAHEGLTAYGLMQFKDMQRVHRVDQALIDRTAAWLLTRKNGKGGWKTSKRERGRWSAEHPAGDAYITWAMSEAGFGGKIRPEIEKSYQDALESADPYVMALVINTLHNIKDGRAEKLLKTLLKQQEVDGSWKGKTSMTRSGGKSLKIETTALAALAIIKVGKGLTQLEKAMNFIAQSKTDYGFGSTQSTVLAMKALIEYALMSSRTNTDGLVKLLVDGQEVAQQAFVASQKTPIVFDEIGTYFTEGNHDVKVVFSSEEAVLPFDLSIEYFTSLPKNDKECKVDLKTILQESEGKVGDNIRLTVQLQNKTNEILPNTIAKIGIPSGLNLQPWQLEELQEKLAFDFYEIMDGYLVLHYREMEANELIEVNLDLKADLAGTFEAPASVAYLYYTNELRNWSKPERMEINQ